MPGLGDVTRLIENDHGQNSLRGEKCDTRCSCDPRKNINKATDVALRRISHRLWIIQFHWGLTKMREHLAGLRIDVQWYLNSVS